MAGIDSYTLNKVAGWVLGTALLVFGLNELSHLVYHAEAPEEPGMVVEIAEQTPAVEDTGDGEAPQLASLLAAGDPAAGESAARACQACHTFEEGGAHRVGPNLWDVVGRPIASAEGYQYSDALQARSGETWTYEALNEFIEDPRGTVPGTKMSYGGMQRPEQRADLLVYLRTLSADPEPLPEPAAQGEEKAAQTQEDAEQPAGEAGAEGQAQDIAQLVAAVDPEQGQAASRACQACHTFEEGGPHRVGPNLWGVVGRPIASAEGYQYSEALQAKSGEMWTLENLNQFIQNPRGFAPGTKMTYGGMKSDEQRVELLAYLHGLSDNPVPLTQPAAEPAQEDAQAPQPEAQPAEQATAPAQEPAEQPAEQTTAEPAQEPAQSAAQQPPAEPAQQPAQSTAQAPAGDAGGEPAAEPAGDTAPAEGEGGIAQLVAAADPQAGQSASRVCQACHTFEEGGAHRVGPNLWGVVGRPIASAEGYQYSDALQAKSGDTWTLDNLNEFIMNPRGFAPGTKMAYGGMRRDDQRMDLLAYLRTLGGEAAPQ